MGVLFSFNSMMTTDGWAAVGPLGLFDYKYRDSDFINKGWFNDLAVPVVNHEVITLYAVWVLSMSCLRSPLSGSP